MAPDVGLKVHKLIGYGLLDVETEVDRGWRIADRRINHNSSAFRGECPSLEEYREWLEAGRARAEDPLQVDLELFSLTAVAEEKRPRPPDLDYAVTHAGEYGIPEVLLVQPPTYRDWSRFDDTIDYIEETYLQPNGTDPQSNRVRELRHGIYPFLAYMDSRTGEKVDDCIFDWIRATTSTRPRLSLAEHDDLAQAAGFESSESAWEHVAPVVPSDVKNLVEFLELFTDDTVWRQMRPMVYTYWA